MRWEELTPQQRHAFFRAWAAAQQGVRPRDPWWLTKLALHITAVALSLAALFASCVAVTIAGRILK